MAGDIFREVLLMPGSVVELGTATEQDLGLRDPPATTTSAADRVWARQPSAAARPQSRLRTVTTAASRCARHTWT
jgi:hypothetical protein